MKDRADYARKGIARGRSLAAAVYDTGILICAENQSSTLHKVSEIYDHIGFAAVGKYNEFDQLRIAGIRHADLKGFSYSREDVDARSLANAYAQILGQVFTHEMKPMEVEILVAEVSTDGAARPDVPPALRRHRRRRAPIRRARRRERGHHRTTGGGLGTGARPADRPTGHGHRPGRARSHPGRARPRGRGPRPGQRSAACSGASRATSSPSCWASIRVRAPPTHRSTSRPPRPTTKRSSNRRPEPTDEAVTDDPG